MAMKKYSVVLLILLLNGSYGDENRDSKVPNDVASTTTSTTLHPLIELIMRPLLQKEGNTVCKDDVLQCLRPLPNMIQSQEQKIIKMKDQEISKKDEKIEKLTNDTIYLRYQAENYFKLVAYYSCAIDYKVSIEIAIDTNIKHAREANSNDRYLIHRKIQEERIQRKKLLGEIVTNLGELAVYYIRLSKNNAGKTSALMTSQTSVKAIASESTTCSQTMITSITTTTNTKSTTIKWKTIDGIKKAFKHQIKNLIQMKISANENASDLSFLSRELSWLSEQQQYNDEIWKHWESNVLLWNEYYRYEWKFNALNAPQITQYSNSLQRTLVDEEGGLLSDWGVFHKGFQNYAIVYENQTRKASFSELEMECLWILYVEKDTFLHKAVEMLLEQSPESNRNKWKELREKSINNDLLYHEVCHDISTLYNKVRADVQHIIPHTLKPTILGCPKESPVFNEFLRIISRENPRVAEISLILRKIFSHSK